jgi:8-oxo-dGTP pyrophosphatase MutT (NUDIX family)
MTADLRRRLAERLHRTVPPPDRWRSDYDLNPGMRPEAERQLVDAAVLVPLIDRDSDVSVLLTRRADDLPSHSGQISFPGGKVHGEDADAIAAALRETEEEVGIAPAEIEVVGCLDRYETRTGFSILPVVGFAPPDASLVLDSREVAEAFEVPLSFLMDATRHERHSRLYEGHVRHFYAMPYGDYYIWGATAGMLKLLYDTLYG